MRVVPSFAEMVERAHIAVIDSMRFTFRVNRVGPVTQNHLVQGSEASQGFFPRLSRRLFLVANELKAKMPQVGGFLDCELQWISRRPGENTLSRSVSCISSRGLARRKEVHYVCLSVTGARRQSEDLTSVVDQNMLSLTQIMSFFYTHY